VAAAVYPPCALGRLAAGNTPAAGLVNFSAYSPRISRLAARQGTGQAADLPGSGSYPLNRPGRRCYGPPLPYELGHRHQLNIFNRGGTEGREGEPDAAIARLTWVFRFS